MEDLERRVERLEGLIKSVVHRLDDGANSIDTLEKRIEEVAQDGRPAEVPEEIWHRIRELEQEGMGSVQGRLRRLEELEKLLIPQESALSPGESGEIPPQTLGERLDWVKGWTSETLADLEGRLARLEERLRQMTRGLEKTIERLANQQREFDAAAGGQQVLADKHGQRIAKLEACTEDILGLFRQFYGAPEATAPDSESKEAIAHYPEIIKEIKLLGEDAVVIVMEVRRHRGKAH